MKPGLEEAIATRNKHNSGITNGREVVRLAQRFGTSAEDVRGVLKKLGFELERTMNGRPIWRK
jgi:hypothetical protein